MDRLVANVLVTCVNFCSSRFGTAFIMIVCCGEAGEALWTSTICCSWCWIKKEAKNKSVLNRNYFCLFFKNYHKICVFNKEHIVVLMSLWDYWCNSCRSLTISSPFHCIVGFIQSLEFKNKWEGLMKIEKIFSKKDIPCITVYTIHTTSRNSAIGISSSVSHSSSSIWLCWTGWNGDANKNEKFMYEKSFSHRALRKNVSLTFKNDYPFKWPFVHFAIDNFLAMMLFQMNLQIFFRRIQLGALFVWTNNL